MPSTKAKRTRGTKPPVPNTLRQPSQPIVVRPDTNENIGIVDLRTIRTAWQFKVEENTDAWFLKVELQEHARSSEEVRRGPGWIWTGGEIGLPPTADKLGESLRIDGGFLPAPLVERFARALLATVEAAKAEHPEHWVPLTDPNAQLVELELDLLRPRSKR